MIRIGGYGTLHSYNQFHAAGHGAFVSGQITNAEHQSAADFLWVYDCGSKRKNTVNALVVDLANSTPKDTLDLLCISHFDSDHVNGLDVLFNSFRVDVLVLPYLPLSRRLEIASRVDLDEQDAAEVMLFALDPVSFIQRRYPGAEIGEYVLIMGGRESASDDGAEVPQNRPPIDGDRRDERRQSSLFPDATPISEEDAYGEGFAGGGRHRQQIVKASHSVPVAPIAALWEFVFFNKDLPQGMTPVSGKPLKTVVADVRAVVQEHWPVGTRQPKSTFRDELRACYDAHFGITSTARNDISLCLLSRPKQPDRFKQCSLYRSPTSETQCAHILVPISTDNGRLGLLLTGDISMDKQAVTEMRQHYGRRRWDDIHVMQVPHHGSDHSWKPGVAALCDNAYSVLCVPDSSTGHHHPHLSVMKDLKDKKVLFANYSQSVVYSFHGR